MIASNITVIIAANCDDVLAFLQEVALKATQVLAEPLLLQSYMHETSWFRQWVVRNLKQPAPQNTIAPQYQSSIMGFLSEVVTRLKNAEGLCPVVASEHDADMILPHTDTQVIIADSVVNRLTILLVPPPSTYHFINAHNATKLQTNCMLTYFVNNTFLLSAFCQALK